ncbi:hypothetical protein ABG768_018551, partial [Culter alburnus]
MARHAPQEDLLMTVDSEEEFSSSSEDDEDIDDEGLHFEEGFDPAQDTFSD